MNSQVQKIYSWIQVCSQKTAGVLEDVLGLWRPWHSLKFLALASRPQVLENWPVLGSRTAVFFDLLKFCGALEKFFGKRFFVEIAWKIFVKTFFFGDRLKNFCEDLFFLFLFWRALVLVSLVHGLGLEHSCPWPRECLCSERLSLALASDFFCVLGLGLKPCVLDSAKGGRGLLRGSGAKNKVFTLPLNLEWFFGLNSVIDQKKKKKGLHQKSERFFCPNVVEDLKKRSSTKIGTIFIPKFNHTPKEKKFPPKFGNANWGGNFLFWGRNWSKLC